MTQEQMTSLQQRIVNEITSTYNSIAEYKNHTIRTGSQGKVYDRPTADRRIQIVEHKLKALKMMLAKIDDGEHAFCDRCHQPIPPKNKLLKRPKNRFCSECT